MSQCGPLQRLRVMKHSNAIKTALSIVLLVLCFASCKKDSNTDLPEQTALVPELKTLTQKYAPVVQQFTYKNEDGLSINGFRGTRIVLQPFTYGNTSGDVHIELREVYTRKDMLGAGIYTETNDGRLLSSLGMFEIKAFRGATLVEAQKDAAVSMALLPGSSPTDTKVFKLVRYTDSIDGSLIEKWVEYDENWTDDSSAAGRCKFNFNINTWCNLDRYLAYNGETNALKVVLPAGFGSANTVAYFHLNGVNGLGVLYVNNADKHFYSLNSKSGDAGKIILTALKNNIYYKKELSFTFSNVPQTFTVTEMEATDKAGLEAILNAF